MLVGRVGQGLGEGRVGQFLDQSYGQNTETRFLRVANGRKRKFVLVGRVGQGLGEGRVGQFLDQSYGQNTETRFLRVAKGNTVHE